jgi:diguanylate cyclase (GGDEF)-like protein
MNFYLATSFIFPRSLRLRLFALCFVATHMPLLGYFGWGLATGRIALAESLLLLGATVVGTAFALIGIGALLSPIHQLADTLKGANDDTPAPPPILPEVGDVIHSLYAGVHRAASVTQARIERLDSAAHEDPLTGIANRRGFVDHLDHLPLADRSGCLALLDIDHFKRVNDSLGHEEGDRVLQAFASRLSGQLRRVDLVARWGGEEFAIFFQNCVEDEAGWTLARIAEQMRRDPIGEVEGRSISFSAGLCRWNGEPVEEPLRCADEALYEAKRMGRDRVRRASRLPAEARN